MMKLFLAPGRALYRCTMAKQETWTLMNGQAKLNGNNGGEMVETG